MKEAERIITVITIIMWQWLINKNHFKSFEKDLVDTWGGLAHIYIYGQVIS